MTHENYKPVTITQDHFTFKWFKFLETTSHSHVWYLSFFPKCYSHSSFRSLCRDQTTCGLYLNLALTTLWFVLAGVLVTSVMLFLLSAVNAIVWFILSIVTGAIFGFNLTGFIHDPLMGSGFGLYDLIPKPTKTGEIADYAVFVLWANAALNTLVLYASICAMLLLRDHFNKIVPAPIASRLKRVKAYFCREIDYENRY